MGHPSTLYRFRFDYSDVDRNVYGQLDFRIAMHPSETPIYLLTRVFAFVLNTELDSPSAIEFSAGGLSDPDQPCLQAKLPGGGIRLWIEIGQPSARKLHRAAKAAQKVKVYTYKNPHALLQELTGERIHRSSEIEIFSFTTGFLETLARSLGRDNRWALLAHEGALTVTTETGVQTSELTRSVLAL